MGNIPSTTLTVPSYLMGSFNEKEYSPPFLIYYFIFILANVCILFYSCYSWSVQNFPRIFCDTQLASPDQKAIAFHAGISPLQDWAHSEDTLVKLSQQEAEFKLLITRKESWIMQETSQRRLPNTVSATWALGRLVSTHGPGNSHMAGKHQGKWNLCFIFLLFPLQFQNTL